MQTGRAQLDPTYKLAETLTTKKVEHRPSMPQKELPEYFRRLEAEPLHPLTRLGLAINSPILLNLWFEHGLSVEVGS